jgi:hypothetical protein
MAARVSLPPARRDRFDAPPHGYACALRRPGYHAPHAHAPLRRSYRAT